MLENILDWILDIMEMIVAHIMEIIENLIAFATALFYGVVFLLILATLPVWIIPFLIWKRCRDV